MAQRRLILSEEERRERIREWNRRYKEKHPERWLASKKRWRDANKKRQLEAGNAWRRSHPDKVKAAQKRQYVANAQKRRAASLAYYRANREVVLAKRKTAEGRAEGARRMREWNAANRERARAKVREWRKRNPGWWKDYNAKKRAALRGCAIVDRPAIKAIYDLARSSSALPCRWCDALTLPGGRHVDHVVPLSKGGSHAPANLCIACVKCNLQKNASHPEEFLRRRKGKVA